MEQLQSEASIPIDFMNVIKEFVILRIKHWISGNELIERWKVKPLDLVDLVLRKKLHVFEPDGKLVDYKYEEEIRINHPSPFPPSPPKDNPSVYDLIFNAEAYDFKIPAGYIPPDYIPLAHKIEHCMFRLIEVERLEKEHNLIFHDTLLKNSDKNELFYAHEEQSKKEATQLLQTNYIPHVIIDKERLLQNTSQIEFKITLKMVASQYNLL